MDRHHLHARLVAPDGRCHDAGHRRFDLRCLRPAARLDLEPIERAEKQFRVREVRSVLDRRRPVEREPGGLQPAAERMGPATGDCGLERGAEPAGTSSRDIGRRGRRVARRRSRSVDAPSLASNARAGPRAAGHTRARAAPRARPCGHRRAAARAARRPGRASPAGQAAIRARHPGTRCRPARSAARIGGNEAARAPGSRRMAFRASLRGFRHGGGDCLGHRALVGVERARAPGRRRPPRPPARRPPASSAPRRARSRRLAGSLAANVALTQSTMGALERKFRPSRSAAERDPANALALRPAGTA